LVIGRRVLAMHLYDRRLRWSVPRWLPARIKAAWSTPSIAAARYLLFRLAEDTLLVHFGMTAACGPTARHPPRRTHDHVDIVLDSGVTLRYHDPRRFGAMLWLPSPPTPIHSSPSLGPEPFDPACDADYLWTATRRRSAAVKLVLMDNHLIVGIGNIYANESLFRAGIRRRSPRIASRSLASPAC
jgi:formamidopyrimidine-DNA glycosylase